MNLCIMKFFKQDGFVCKLCIKNKAGEPSVHKR